MLDAWGELFRTTDGLGVIGVLLAMFSSLLLLGNVGRKRIARALPNSFSKPSTKSLNTVSVVLSLMSLAAGLGGLALFGWTVLPAIFAVLVFVVVVTVAVLVIVR